MLLAFALLAAIFAAAPPAAAQDGAGPAAAFALRADEAAAFAGLDAGWQSALETVVNAERSFLPGPAPYMLTSFDTYPDASGEWAVAVIVPQAVVAGGWENLDLDQLVDVLLLRTPDGRITGHVRPNPAFLELARAVPRQLIDYSPLLAASAGTATVAQDGVNYLLPWTAGQTWWGGGGWHSGYGANALDFAPWTSADPAVQSAVLAAEGGILRMACQNDDQQRLLWIEHPNGEKTGYLHLDRASVGAAVEDAGLVGQQVPQGRFLGTLYRGDAKIDGACPAFFPDCTFNTLCGYGSGPHVHFLLPRRDLQIDGYSADAIGSGTAGNRFTSTNQRQDLAVDREAPSAALLQPLAGSSTYTATPAAELGLRLAVTDGAGSGVAAVQVRLAWQNADGNWFLTGWSDAEQVAPDVYAAAFGACTPAWRVPHNRPLRVSLQLADKEGNRAEVEDAGVFRYFFPDLNQDCVVEIKDVLDLLPVLAGSSMPRAEHDIDNSGAVDAADMAALLAAVFDGWVSVTRSAVPLAAGVFPGMGKRVDFTPLPAPEGLASARDVALLGTAALVADWRAGNLALVDVSLPATATVTGVLPLSDRVYGVTTAGGLAYVSDAADEGRMAVLDITQPLTAALAATITLPGELMEPALVGDELYVAAGSAGWHWVDVADPRSPSLLATLDTPGTAADVSAAGSLVFVADQENGLLIYAAGVLSLTEPVSATAAITSPAPITRTVLVTPSLLATWDTPGSVLGVTAVLSTVYVADGLGGIQVLDAADPRAPRLLATYATDSAANSVVVSGTTLYAAVGWQGILALDVADPAAPYLAGSIRTPGYAHDLALAGNLLAVADGAGGLQLLQVAETPAPDHYLLIPFAARP